MRWIWVIRKAMIPHCGQARSCECNWAFGSLSSSHPVQTTDPSESCEKRLVRCLQSAVILLLLRTTSTLVTREPAGPWSLKPIAPEEPAQYGTRGSWALSEAAGSSYSLRRQPPRRNRASLRIMQRGTSWSGGDLYNTASSCWQLCSSNLYTSWKRQQQQVGRGGGLQAR